MTVGGGSGAMAMSYGDAIDIPAGQPVSLNPNGPHVWLAGLNQPLTAGQSVPQTLKFERRASVWSRYRSSRRRLHQAAPA